MSANRTEYIVTNDHYLSSRDDVEFEIQTRWKIEDINREIKQLTGLGRVSVSYANNSKESYCLCNGACGTF